jgi:hypothetical protein
MPILPFGDWRPDIADYQQQYSKTITNVVARGDGYGPVKALQGFSDALPATCRGAFLATQPDGTIAVFAGTLTRLYKLDNTTLEWDDVTRTNATQLDLSGALADGYIGNMTDGGGLNDAFDTDETENAASGAARAAETTAYVGVTFADATVVRAITVYGSNDAGFVSAINPTVVITAYGKDGTAPASGTDGTELGSVTFTDTADESAGRACTMTVTGKSWDHCWVYITHNGAANQINCAEVRIFSVDEYELSSAEHWQFAQFGDDVLATQANDPVQRFTLNSSAAFAALAGSPPAAAFITVVSYHVVLSGLLNNPDRIAWSAQNDITGWTAGSGGSDTQDFGDGGACLAVAGGEFGVVFQTEAIRRMAFVGGDTIFEFERISEGEGLAARYSVVRAGPRIFFYGTSGFQSITAGQYPVAISKERWHRFFQSDWDNGEYWMMLGTNEARSSRVWWFYKSISGASGLTNRAICYDWALDKPSYITGVTSEFPAVLSQPGATLEGLVDLGYTDIDVMDLSFDSFEGSSGLQLGLFNSDHQMGFLTGDNLEATVETGDYAFDRRYFIRSQRPLSDAATAFGSFTTRQKISDTAVQSQESAMNSIGFCPHRGDTRMSRFRIRIPASTEWTYIHGTEPEAANTGRQ